MKNKGIIVLNQEIHINKDDYFSLTDIARYKNSEAPRFAIQNWIPRIDTIQYIGLWEQLNNLNFIVVEFDQFKNEACHNYFTLSPKKWITGVNAIGIISKAGKHNAGTYAHNDIALQFASWILLNIYCSPCSNLLDTHHLKFEQTRGSGYFLRLYINDAFFTTEFRVKK